MQEIQYIGEHLLPGQIGQFSIILGFVASLLSFLAYFFATQKRALPEFENWKKIGRASFLIHGISVFSVMGIIFYLMVNQYFEYHYVWQHVSEDLAFRYIFSAFWEGQEGSFLLWMFWHVVLGLVLMIKAKEWEAPVLSILALIQVFIFSMILGVYFGEDFKIGVSPFVLIRDVMDIPLFNNADYVSLIKGNGLNPLLQNYWMTIHPPTLFLGFASTAVPFCYAIAGLWTNQHKAWLKPVLPWALFSGAILGTGILMGGAWAYEALSFGGYWAWDPVENMSLVPWIILIAGIHTNLIARSTNYSIKSTYLFYLLTFIMIVYSTFLTRSGVLGETSVHAFTEMGLENQLVLFIAAFTLLGGILWASKYKQVPSPEKEEPTPSREFWMFIGTLVLMFSAAMITASTSLPIYNKIAALFNPDFDPIAITEPIPHYNKYQLWIAVFIGALSGLAQLMRYKEINWKSHSNGFYKIMGGAAILSGVLTYLGTLWIDARAWQYLLLLFCGIFAILTNMAYLINVLKGNLKLAGSVFSHLGFGIMIIGVMASGLNKRHISTNPIAQRGLLEEDMLQENVLLFKGMPMFMSGYLVTYEKDTMIRNERFFEVNYQKISEEGDVVENFTVTPTALYDNKVTKVAAYNPSTKHYPHKDIFTHIATLPKKEADFEYAKEQEDSMQYEVINIPINGSLQILDTINSQDVQRVIETEASIVSIHKNGTHPDYIREENDIAIGMKIAFRKPDEDTVFYAEPVLVVRGQLLYTYPVQMNDLSVKVRLTEGVLDRVFPIEADLDYKKFVFKKGETIFINGLEIEFSGFNKSPEHAELQGNKVDLAVGGLFEVNDPNGAKYFAEPVYLIQGNRPLNLKDEVIEHGLHFRFTAIDPNSESIEVMIAQDEHKDEPIPIEIAKKSFRTDYIILESIIFPGINLFWLGTILMMFGLGFSMVRRMRN